MADLRLEDTIAAIATPIGEGGISVIRLSGSCAFEVAGKIFSPKENRNLDSFSSHTIHLGEIRNEKNETIDQVLVSIFRSPHSYTGEDVIEISSHGGLGVSKRILDLLIERGARHAEPGEFTRRAFLNGRIDLTQAEAVLDLIKAKSEKSLEVAIRQLGGRLSQKFKALKDELMKLYAHMEAYLDFPEEHLEVYSDAQLLQRLDVISSEIKNLLASFKRGSLLREGLIAVIVGKPNVGKSALFNALLERDRALVSEFPGTTRDSLEESLEIEGIYVRMIDTAGLSQHAGHPLDFMGMERTRRSLQEGHIYLFVVDGSIPLSQEDEIVFHALEKGKPFMALVNKTDLEQKIDLKKLRQWVGKESVISISSKTRRGLEFVEKKIIELIMAGNMEKEGEQITRLRHKNALSLALEALNKAKNSLIRNESLEIVILDLKAALDALKELIGEIYSEDLLDVIFSEFCIGK